MDAFLIPSAFDLLCFVKKLTVIGIIGKTQGVNKAAKPLRNDKMKMVKTDLSSLLSFSFVIFVSLNLSCATFVESIEESTCSEFTDIDAVSTESSSFNLFDSNPSTPFTLIKIVAE